jgi:hypothetical protein
MNPGSGTQAISGLTAVIAAAALAFGGALLETRAASADSGNESNLQQLGIQAQGGSSGGGVAGPAITFNIAPKSQVNVGVIAGDDYTKENSSQTASNSTDVGQIALAKTGDASASGGGSATSGPAIAGNISITQQANIQVIAGAGCSAHQAAANSHNLAQGAAASSGDATAGNGGKARSGAASALNIDVTRQNNIQVYTCIGGNTVAHQGSLNASGTGQLGASLGADADASGGGNVVTGDTTTLNLSKLRQTNRQFVHVR